MKMKRLAVWAAIVAIGVNAVATDAVIPATVTITNLRAQAVETITGVGSLYQGSTLLFTNCLIYSGGTTGSAVQGLDGVTVEVSVGTASTNVDYTATVQSAAGGTWYRAVTVPTSDFSMSLRITDANTNRYIYPLKQFITQPSMF
jgi:hypothetical protein